jgi:hypothetical protein
MDKDPRKAFIGISQMLADGHPLSEVRQVTDALEDPADPADPRQRFIMDSQRLARGESLASVAKSHSGQPARQVRQDDFRMTHDGRLKITDQDQEPEDDPRGALLKRLAALSAA